MYSPRPAAGAGGGSGTADEKPRVLRYLLGGVDTPQGVCEVAVMNGTAVLFPELERTENEAKRAGLLERWRNFGTLAEQFGGLAPQAFVDELLGVSRQRVHQLVEQGHLEQVDFMGTKWISARSLTDWINHPKQAGTGGGRGRSRPSKWRQFVFTAKTSLAELGAVIPDEWVE